MQINSTIGSRPYGHGHPGAWLVAKAGLILAAILLLTLIVAALEVRLGVTPSDDSATFWMLSGE